MSIPQDLKYTEEHEWVKPAAESGSFRVGITDFAQDQLGDVVYVELPRVGDELKAGQPFGVVESVKAASDLYSPLSGRVTAVNDALVDAPELVNVEPYAGGWMLEIQAADESELSGLLDAAAYADVVAEEE